jgi:hypothetical protein
MDSICLSHFGLYGFRHELQICSGCRITYCRCFESLRKCSGSQCDKVFCSNCISFGKMLKPIDEGSCLCGLCFECQMIDNNHGNYCSIFRNNIKMTLYSRIQLPVDMIENISDFLWKVTQSITIRNIIKNLSYFGLDQEI